MLRYILVAVLIVAFIMNFKIKSIIEFFVKKEISEKQEVTAKLIAYAVAVACAVLIMVFC